MPFAGYSLNSPHSAPWVDLIGKFMVNFGGIEFGTFLWIDYLTTDTVLKELVVEMPFSRRTELIRRLVEERGLPKSQSNDVKAILGSAGKLARLRNEIAHSPIIFGWHGTDEDRPPDFIGSLNFKKIPSQGKRVTPLLEMNALRAGVDEASRIAGKLHDLLAHVRQSGEA